MYTDILILIFNVFNLTGHLLLWTNTALTLCQISCIFNCFHTYFCINYSVIC